MDPSKFEKYRTAGEIADSALAKAIELCHQKLKASEICLASDKLMMERLNKGYKKLSKGIYLPTCLSINSVIAHDTFTEKNDYQLKENDIVRIELACHIDNNIVSVGETIKIGDSNYNQSEQMLAALKAMEVGIQKIQPDIDTIEYKKSIEKVTKELGYYLVPRPDVFQEEDTTIFYDWCFRDNKFFCEPSWVVKKDNELELYNDDEFSEEEFDMEHTFTTGEVYHLSVVISDKNKKSVESDRKPQLYQKSSYSYNLKSKHARELLNLILKDYSNRFWRIDDIDIPEGKKRLGLKMCLDSGVIRGLGIANQTDSNIVLMKCSVIIQDNSIYKLTGRKYKTFGPYDKLSEELNKILNYPKQFDKRLELN